VCFFIKEPLKENSKITFFIGRKERIVEKIKAAIMYKVNDIRIEEVERPKVGMNEVMLKVKSVGICGSDLHYYKHGRIGKVTVNQPIILGHETAGEIVEIGKNVKERHVGDRVIIEPGTPCGVCKMCKTGRYNLCLDMIFRAHPPTHGTFVEFLVCRSDLVFPIPDDMSFEVGAMLEPLAVGVYVSGLTNTKPDDTVTILGSGPIGLSILQVMRAIGVSKIFITDLLETRLELAKRLGATAAINVSIKDPVKEIMDLTNGNGTEIVIEAVGDPKTYFMTTDIAAMGGTIIFVGMASETVFPINVDQIVSKELIVKGSFRYANAFPKAIALAASGKVDMGALITHRYPFEKIKEAMDCAYECKDKAIKVVVNF